MNCQDKVACATYQCMGGCIHQLDFGDTWQQRATDRMQLDNSITIDIGTVKTKYSLTLPSHEYVFPLAMR